MDSHVVPIVAVAQKPGGGPIKGDFVEIDGMQAALKQAERERRTLKWMLGPSFCVVVGMLAMVIVMTVALSDGTRVSDGGMLVVKETNSPVAVASQQKLSATCASLLNADHSFQRTIAVVTFEGPDGEFTVPVIAVATIRIPAPDPTMPNPSKTLVLTSAMGSLMCDAGSPNQFLVAELSDLIGVPPESFAPAPFVQGQGLRAALRAIGMVPDTSRGMRRLFSASIPIFTSSFNAIIAPTA